MHMDDAFNPGWIPALMAWRGIHPRSETWWTQWNHDALLARCLDAARRFPDWEGPGEAFSGTGLIYDEWMDLQQCDPGWAIVEMVVAVVQEANRRDVARWAKVPLDGGALIVSITMGGEEAPDGQANGEARYVAALPPPFATVTMRPSRAELEDAIEELVHVGLGKVAVLFHLLGTAACECGHDELSHTKLFATALDLDRPNFNPRSSCLWAGCTCDLWAAVSEPEGDR